MAQLPIIFLAFANEKIEDARYLRGLAVEQRKLKEALESAVDAGLCELLVETNATLPTIINTFQKAIYRDRIAVFHYGGHADGYQLLLETADNSNEVAHGEGVVSFLSGQKGLRLIFLNGCSTQQQAQELVRQGVSAVIGTSQAIADEIATQLAERFYRSLGQGNALDRAWKEAQDYIHIRKGSSNTRSLYFFDEDEDEESIYQPDRMPWDIYLREGSEIVKTWNLPAAGNNPLFGLPEISDRYLLPEKPFRYLRRYTRDDARVFFGRSHFIHALYKHTTDPNGPPLLLFHGQSGAGKSSLLDSGLFPRIEESHEVVYVRRDPELGLLGTLQKALGVASRDLNLQQLQAIAEEFDQQTRERFRAFIAQLAQQEHHSEAVVPFSAEELAHFRQAGSLLPVWKQIEARTGKPLILILDQVEEMYTRPMQRPMLDSPFDSDEERNRAGQRAEFAQFISALQKLVGNNHDLPQGKLVLAYRKEYHPEIEESLRHAELPRVSLFLEHLDYQNVLEIITAFVTRPYLRKEYHLQIEDGLPEAIARDLTTDTDSPVAPVLQIILSRLWDLAHQKDPESPTFTFALYQRILEDGIDLRDFFLQQMRVLKSMRQELEPMVESGLALDLLKFHVTELGTAGSRQMERIRDRYQEHQAEIDLLVKNCTDLSLLASLNQAEQTMLAHDTLAPIVEMAFNESDKPAQRAARVLAAKMIEVNNAQKIPHEAERQRETEKILLLGDDLTLVEKGSGHMRSLLPQEHALIKRSQAKRDEELRKRRRNRGLQVATLLLLVVGAVVFALYQRQARQDIYKATAKRVQYNLEEAEYAMRRLHYPEAFRLLDESAQLGINGEKVLARLNELAYIYIQVDNADSNAQAIKYLRAALPLLDAEPRKKIKNAIPLLEQDKAAAKAARQQFLISEEASIAAENAYAAQSDALLHLDELKAQGEAPAAIALAEEEAKAAENAFLAAQRQADSLLPPPSAQTAILRFIADLDSTRQFLTDSTQERRLKATYFPQFVLVPGGTFQMGSPDPVLGEEDAIPVHSIALADYSISRYEVTTAQYNLYAMSFDKMPLPPSSDWLADLPMVAITYGQAEAYCRWLSFMVGDSIHLPTEAQWEYAARGGPQSRGFLYAGSDSLDLVAHYKDNTNFAQPVGQKAPNELGLYDMSGNVKEWCYDFYDARHYAERRALGTVPDPLGPPQGEFFVARGGGWSQEVNNQRVSFRFAYDGQSYSDVVLGFRVARYEGDRR